MNVFQQALSHQEAGIVSMDLYDNFKLVLTPGLGETIIFVKILNGVYY